jgi:hypothetical protein
VILFFALTGTHPHEDDNVVHLLRAIAQEPPASIDVLRPGLDPQLRALVRDCLKPRISRIATAALLRDRLGAVIASGRIPVADRLPARAVAVTSTDESETQVPIIPETVGSVTELWMGAT